MKDTMKAMAERLANKIKVAKIGLDNERYHLNKRECPFYSEWKGMEQALKTLGIDYEYEYNDEYMITAVTVMGQRVEL